MRLSVNFLHFYLRARLHFHQAGDDHAIAGFQTIGNQPFVANRLVCLQRAQLNFVVCPTTNAVASPRGLRVTPC